MFSDSRRAQRLGRQRRGRLDELLLSPFYDVVTMRPPRLNVSSVRPVRHPSAQQYENAFAVTVTAEASAAFVWLEAQYPERWSDNGFLMTEASHGLQLQSLWIIPTAALS